MDKDHQDSTLAKCSFCNRNQSIVQKLIAGPEGVYICDNCVELAHSIIFNEKKETASPEPEEKFPTPFEIKKALDDYIIGQESVR